MPEPAPRCEVHGDEKTEVVPDVWKCYGHGAPDACTPPKESDDDGYASAEWSWC